MTEERNAKTKCEWSGPRLTSDLVAMDTNYEIDIQW